VAADPNDASSHNSLGFALARSSPDEAAEEYAKAAQLWANSPDRAYALRNWADLLNSQREYSRAEEKCREAIKVPFNPDEAWLRLARGRALAGQGDEDGSFKEFEQARNLIPKPDSSGREILWAYANALLQRERFDESLAEYKLAVDLSDSQDTYFALFYYGCALYAAGDPDGALRQYQRAIDKDAKHPYAHHNTAAVLFRLGSYEKGWQAWAEARCRYDAALDPAKASLKEREDLIEQAVYFADVLREIFVDYDRSLEWYQRVLEARPKYTAAVCGRAILLRRMQQSSPTVAVQLRGNQAMREACEQLEQALTRPDRFYSLLVLADLCIENHEWQRLRHTLDLAEPECKDLRLRNAELLIRSGILSLATDKPDDAVRFFEQALVDREGYLRLMANLGLALLNSKRYESALQAFKRVLNAAPGNVEALIGSARTCIELADDGDTDRYEMALKFLTQSLKYGREGGSTRLREIDIADVYYMRGYAKTKRYEADRLSPLQITPALHDFRQAIKNNPDHDAAQAAFNKVARRIAQRASESTSNAIGTVLVSLAAAIVFAFAQIDFFLRGTWLHRILAMPPTPLLEKPGYYATVTFSSLAIMIAGLSLGKLLKLKVAGIELEKASADPTAPAAGLNIGRFGLFENFQNALLQGLGATPLDLSGPSAKTAPATPDKIADSSTTEGS
jgi:tetratricopeptide (TPR) repeat protein